MNEGLIARRYALALLKVARKHHAEEEIYRKMKLFEQNFISHPDLQKALMNPLLSARDKEVLLTTAIGIEPGNFYVRGIRMVIENHREMYLRSICLMYQRLYRQMYGIERVKIITAAPLAPEAMERIKKMVTGHIRKRIEFVEKIDPEIIGGFILRIGSEQFDYSVSGKLKEVGSSWGI